MSSEQELLISTTQTSSVFSTWKLEIEAIEEGFYGYGYGNTGSFGIVDLHGSGSCIVDISTGAGPYSGTVSGTIETGLGWEALDQVTVSDLDNLETYSGEISSYNYITGDVVITIASHDISVSSVTHNCELRNPNPPSLNYFNVIGLAGTFSGYGYKDAESPANITDFESEYSYGWGYEYGCFIFADLIDEITVRARVLKDDIPQDNISVFFWGSVDVILNPSIVLTDSDGYATTIVKINKDLNVNQIDGWGGETEMNRETPLVFRGLSGSGGRTVSAMIYENPEYDDGQLTVASQSEQRFFSQVVFNLDIGSYAFNVGEDI